MNNLPIADRGPHEYWNIDGIPGIYLFHKNVKKENAAKVVGNNKNLIAVTPMANCSSINPNKMAMILIRAVNMERFFGLYPGEKQSNQEQITHFYENKKVKGRTTQEIYDEIKKPWEEYWE